MDERMADRDSETAAETRTVFVVDDEQDVQWLFRQGFRREVREGKVAFKFAFSGAEALHRLSTGDLPDLVLSDINMPGMSGLELLREIKGRYPDLAVMMITAYGDERNHKTAFDYGAEAYFTKPLDFKELRYHLVRT